MVPVCHPVCSILRHPSAQTYHLPQATLECHHATQGSITRMGIVVAVLREMTEAHGFFMSALCFAIAAGTIAGQLNSSIAVPMPFFSSWSRAGAVSDAAMCNISV